MSKKLALNFVFNLFLYFLRAMIIVKNVQIMLNDNAAVKFVAEVSYAKSMNCVGSEVGVVDQSQVEILTLLYLPQEEDPLPEINDIRYSELRLV